MQYISNYVSAAIPRLLRTARRNAGKITIVTLSAAGAAAIAYHVHKANNQIANTLNNERRVGAERLRSQFLATRSSLTGVFRAIHVTLLDSLQSHALSNPDPFLKRLRQNPSRDEKTAIWRDVLLASITKLCACCVMASAVFVALSVEIELLARYAGQDPESGVAAAPKTIGAEARGAFIDCVRDGAKSSLDPLLSRIRQGVETVFGDLPLTKKVGGDGMRQLVDEILREIDIATLITGWFTNEDIGNGNQQDDLVKFLKNEAMDFFDVLEVEDVSAHAANLCIQELTAGMVERPLVSTLAGLVRECEKDVGQVFEQDPVLMEFGACVFLSGERRR